MAADDRVVKVVLSAEVREYIRGMEEAAQKSRETADETAKVRERAEALKTVGQYALAFGGAMSVAAGAVAKTGIEYNTLQQTSRAALSTLLGGAEAANAQMDKLDEFAKTSPFSKAVFIDAQQQLLGFGQEAERVVPTLDAIQNAVAATGGSNEDIAELVRIIAQLEGGVKISAETFNQFGTRGIDAAGLIGEAMGKTGQQIRDEVTAGTLDADAAIQALTDGMQERFGGAAANVKNTFDGAMDRVKAAWRDVAAELMTPLVDPNGGGFLIDAANGVADLIRQFQALPEWMKFTVSGLGTVAGAASLAGGAFLLGAPKVVEFWDALGKAGTVGAKAQGMLRGMGTFLTGPWGVALGAATVALGIFVNEHIEAEKRAKTYADTLDATTGSITDNTRAMVAEAITAKRGFFGLYDSIAEQADNVGIGLDTVTEAILGNADAYAVVEEAARKAEDEASTGFERRNNAASSLKEAVDEQIDSMGRAKEISEQVDAAMGGVDDANGDAASSSGDVADGFDSVAAAAADAQAVVDDLAAAIRGFGSEELSVRDAHRSFEEAIDDLTQSIEDNGTSLNRSTEEGRKNEAAIDAIAEATLELAASTLEMTGSEEDATRVIRDGREALIRKLEAFGITGEAAQAYADQLGLIPENIETNVGLNGADEAGEKLRKLKEWADAIPSVKRVTLETIELEGGRTVSANADGNLYAYADGGFAPGVYPGGANIHKFAEPETGWEAYISGKPDKRDRNVGVWMQAGERLGVLSGGGSAAPNVQVSQHFNLPPGFTAQQIEAISGRGVQKALR